MSMETFDNNKYENDVLIEEVLSKEEAEKLINECLQEEKRIINLLPSMVDQIEAELICEFAKAGINNISIFEDDLDIDVEDEDYIAEFKETIEDVLSNIELAECNTDNDRRLMFDFEAKVIIAEKIYTEFLELLCTGRCKAELLLYLEYFILNIKDVKLSASVMVAIAKDALLDVILDEMDEEDHIGVRYSRSRGV